MLISGVWVVLVPHTAATAEFRLLAVTAASSLSSALVVAAAAVAPLRPPRLLFMLFIYFVCWWQSGSRPLGGALWLHHMCGLYL